VDVDEVLPEWQLSDRELTAALLASETALCREYARMLALVGETDKRGVAVAKGFQDTAGLLVRSMRISQKEAAARVAQATLVMPAATDALAAGEINSEHVQEIAGVLAQAPDSVTAAELAADTETLVVLARQAIPSTVRKAGMRLLAYWEVEGKDPKDRERDLSRPRREFRYSYTRDGRMKFTGEFDHDTGVLAEGLFVPLAKPDPADALGRRDSRTAAERQGDAVAAIFDLAARAPDLPVAAGERAAITVTIGLDELERRAGTAMLDGYGALSVSQLRRLCCEAKVIPAVLGTHGEVLDMGRAARHATTAQRRALAVRDRGCTGPGCTRGPKWCIPHHILNWADGGNTELRNLGLVCERDHALLHHGGWDMTFHNGVIHWIPPAWLDPARAPIRNTAHDAPKPQAAQLGALRPLLPVSGPIGARSRVSA
jgi:hypothetical protein